MLSVEVITGGLGVNIMDDWAPGAVQPFTSDTCPVRRPESDSDVEALSHRVGLEG